MSWISENYEKVALGAGAALALGLAFIGYSKMTGVEEDFASAARGSGENDASISGADAVPVAKSSFNLTRNWEKGDDAGRPVDLFTGVALFVNKNDLQNPVDLIEGEMVHAPIPNQWWIENRIDPGFGDSPQRDEDEDGFSNLSEFNAGTDPTVSSDYPPLITKLTYVADEALEWVLRPGFPSADGSFTFEYNDTEKRTAKVGAANPVPPGDLFFEEGPLANRFKFIGSEKIMELNEKLNVEVEVTMVEVEDQRANKKGTSYKIPSQFRRGDARKYSQFDRTAVFSLEALGLSGQEIRVEEQTAFSLPPGAETKNFKVLEVTPEKVTVSVKETSGEIENYTILKGATGPVKTQ